MERLLIRDTRLNTHILAAYATKHGATKEIAEKITMTAAIGVIPAGAADTILSAPVLMLLLYTWFGQDAIIREDSNDED
jgi:hypothetical protein